MLTLEPAARSRNDAVAIWDRVTKRYADRLALDDFSLTVGQGEVVALLGPNGAGKTTAINVLLGLRTPDRGLARIFGRDPRQTAGRCRVGVTPQELSFPATLTVREIISFVSSHYVHPKDASTLLGSFGLSDLANRQIGGLSSGQRRRLAIAVAFAGNPRAVVLDEPTAGLDVESRRAAWRTLKEFTAGGRSVLLTTHYLEEAEAFAERIVLINNGRVVVDGSVDQIRSQVVQRRVRFRCAEMPLFAPGVSFEVEGDRYTILADDPDRLVRDLVRRDVPFTGLEVSAASFEEAFLKIIETR